jgi:hypothetical protein
VSCYTSPTLASFPNAMVRLVCDRCGRRGQYRKETLIREYGPDIVVPDLLVTLAKCPRHGAMGDACGVVYADIRSGMDRHAEDDRQRTI